jgi:hypothetical protein
VNVHDVDLTPTSPYVGKFLGYKLDKGHLNVEVNYVMTDRKINASNLLVLDQFTLGQSVDSPDATKLPVKLAIAILKDRNGKIELEVPIEGNLDDPNFHYGPVIMHTIENIIVKMVTSPFAALGSIFGGKSDEVDHQDFTPGSATLTASDVDKLDVLLSGLNERPGLQLGIEGGYDEVKDTEAIRAQKLEKALHRQKWELLRKSEQDRISPDEVSLPPDERADILKKMYNAIIASQGTNAIVTKPPSFQPGAAKKPGEPDEDNATEKGATALAGSFGPGRTAAFGTSVEWTVLATMPVAPEDLKQLAAARAKEVQQKLIATGKIEAARVSLAEAASGSTSNQASRVYFHLE